jgi:uracil-DNA glycosylase family 4
MDARDALRRLLQQRLEAGETTIVLESLRAADIVAPPVVAVTRERAAPAPPLAPVERAAVRESLEERRAGAEEPSSDWRAELQKSGSQTPPNQTMKTTSRPGPAAPPKAGRVVVTPDAPIPAMNSLDEVRSAVGQCTRCALYATALNHVPGEGNPTADFMVVGEAPGQTEDETGKPFVGRAGQLLTQILGAIQLTRDDVFICNVLKHRPPGNRNPEPQEVKACSPYLIRQIELVKPKVILALGTFSAQTLLDTKTPIGKLRGQVHEYHGVPVVVTYHPAALLRNPAWKRPTWEDVQLARRILDSAPPLG